MYQKKQTTPLGCRPARRITPSGAILVGKNKSVSLDFSITIIQNILGQKLGEQLHHYANGIDFSPVLAEPEAAKGYSVSTTLEEDVTTTDGANRILLALVVSVSSRMRADGAGLFASALPFGITTLTTNRIK